MKLVVALGVVALTTTFVLSSFALTDTAPKTKNSKKKTPKKASAKKTTAGPAKRAATNSKTTASARNSSPTIGRAVTIKKVIVTRKKVNGHWVRVTQVVRRPAGPSYQTHPDPERYQQIQQALADNGYFKGEVNGQWGDDSIAALRHFQTDKKIPSDGRISSLTLIGLGLGPHREVASSGDPGSAAALIPAPASSTAVKDAPTVPPNLQPQQ